MARPRSPLLTTELIAQAALELIDSGEPFGVNALARRLGVRPSSLYNHVSGRDEIIELTRGLLARTYAFTATEGPWEEAVETYLRTERRMYTEHPNLLPLIATLTVTDETAIAAYDGVATTLVNAGFPDEDVLVVMQLLDAFALGSGLDYAAPDDTWRPRGETAHLGRLLATAAPGRERSDRAFDLGIRVLVAALRDMLAQRTADAGARPAG